MEFEYDPEEFTISNIRSIHAEIVDEMIYDRGGVLRVAIAESRSEKYEKTRFAVGL